LITKRLDRIEDFLRRVLPVLLANVGDPTHVTVRHAAELLGVSEKTIRRRIAAGTLHLHVIPGTRKSGVPIEELYSGWISLACAKAALQRELREAKSDEQD